MTKRHVVFHSSRVAVAAVGRRARARRMQRFAERFQLRPGMRILDLGGHPEIWESVPAPLDITILNLPGRGGLDVPTPHRVTFVEGDGTRVAYPDQSFDLVFSNSVIEHVGPEPAQRAFAGEVKRLAPRYWVQTPSKWFPIEAHTGMPLWWFYPASLREAFFARWRRNLPAWTDAMASTRVLERAFFQSLFPGSELWVERLAGFPKSYAVFRT
jgi:hypothetical protein